MRVSGVLIALGVVLIALSGLIEGAAVVRWLQDEPQLLLPMPCDVSLPVLIGNRLQILALTDGVDQPTPLVVRWSARDGNGQVLLYGSVPVAPGRDVLLGRIPAGSRRELHLSAQVVSGTPRLAWLRVRPDEASAASLALGGIAVFVLGELTLGLGTVLSIWRMLLRFAKPIKRWWQTWTKSRNQARKARTAKKKPKIQISAEDDLETKPDMSAQTDTQAETAIPSDEDAETEVNPLVDGHPEPRHRRRATPDHGTTAVPSDDEGGATGNRDTSLAPTQATTQPTTRSRKAKP